MFAKILTIAATGIAAVHACTSATPFAANPITAPTVADYPTIGQPYLIQWDNTNQGPTVTLSLYKGCPNNCVEITDIVGQAPNTGSYSWTPSCTTLQPDEDAEGYGILLIDDTLCQTQWSFHFGLHPDSAGVCQGNSAASSTTTAAAAPTSTTTTAKSSTTTATSKASSAVTSTTTTAKSSGTTGKPTTLTSTSAIPTLSTSKTSGAPTASASLKSQGSSTGPVQALDVFGGLVALVAAVFVF